MRIKPLVTTIFGLAIAAGSVFVVSEQFAGTEGALNASPTADLLEVVIARTDIGFGQALERHLLATQSWPREALPAGAFTDLANILPSELDGARRAKGRFFKGEVILATKISSFGDKVTIVQKLGENTRAMAIKVDASTAVGGFVTPGDFVDIVLTHGPNNDMRAVTILQNIRVIGVDQRAEDDAEQPGVAKTITVEVTPDQSQRLALAQKAGNLSLTLRTLDSVEDEPLEMVRLSDLLHEKSPVPEGEASPVITIRRGVEREVVSLD